MADKNVEQTAKEAEGMKKALEAMVALAGNFAQGMGEVAKKAGVAGSAVHRMGQDMNKALGGAEDSLTGYVDGLEEAENQQRKLVDVAKKLPVKSVAAFDAEWKRVNKGLAEIRKKEAKGPLSPKQMEQKKRDLEELVNIQKELNKQMKEEINITGASAKERVSARAKDIADKVSSIKGDVKSGKGLGSIAMKGAPLKDKMGVWGQLASDAGAAMAGKKGGVALMGGLMKGAGGMMGGFSKFLGGPIVAGIMMGVKALWDLGMAADTFVKDANKRFSMIRGPDIMTKDVKGQFKEFNDQLYNMFDNIKVGMNAAQIGEFLSSLTQAGVHLDKLNTGFTNYRDTVYVAAKASKTLGVDTVYVGNMMGTLFMELRMDLDKTNKVFNEIAFDAKKAGLSTDKFWTAIQNSTASLGFWGIFVDKAAKTLTSFSKTQVMGASETAATVTEVTQAFSKMDQTQRSAFVGLVQNSKGGAKALNNAFQKMHDSWDEKAKALQIKINLKEKEDQTPEVVDQIAKLRDEQDADLSKVAMAQKAMASQNAVDMAPYLPMIADSTLDLTTILIKSRVGSWAKLQGRNVRLAEEIAKATGMSADLIMKLGQVASSFDEKMKRQLGLGEAGQNNDQSLLKTMMDAKDLTADEKTKMGEQIENLADISKGVDDGTKSTDDLNEASDAMVNYLKDTLKMSDETAQGVAKMVIMDKSDGKLAKKQLKTILTGNKKDLPGAIAKMGGFTAGLADSMMTEQGNLSKVSDEKLDDMAEDTFKQVKGQTLSYKEMQDIAKDDIKWRASSLGAAQILNKAVFGILDLLSNTVGKDYKSPEAIARDAAIKAAGIKVSKIGKGAFADKPADALKISSAFQELGTRIHALSQDVSNASTASDAMTKALAADSPQKAMNELQKAISKQESTLSASVTAEQKAALAGKLGKDVNTITPKDLKDNFSKIDMTEDQSKMLGTLVSMRGTLEETKAAQADNDKMQKEQAATLANLQKIADNPQFPDDARKQAKEEIKKNKDLMKKKIEDPLKKGLEKADKAKDIAQDQLTQQQKAYGALESVDETNKKIAQFAKWQAMNSDEGKKSMAKSIQDMVKENPNIDSTDLEAATGMSAQDIQKILKDTNTDIGKRLTAQLADTATRGKASSNLASMPTKQGIKTPQKITSPGGVTLHAGETILPKSFAKLQTRDIIGDAAGGGAGGGGGAGQNIQISVNATEKDLAQKIANEVRGVLYKQQVSGMGA